MSVADALGVDPGYADRYAVQGFAKGLSEQFLQCRSLGHNWRPHTATWNRGDRAYDVEYLCPRCETRRVLVLSMRGEVVSSHYVYPDGYQCDLGRIVGEGRDALRLESLARMIPGQNVYRRSTRAGG